LDLIGLGFVIALTGSQARGTRLHEKITENPFYNFIAEIYLVDRMSTLATSVDRCRMFRFMTFYDA
jgi:hypothetical protein